MKGFIKRLLISISIITIALFIPTSALAWDDCPKGKVNDPYPGDCARYIDTDGNGICDHSEPAPEDRIGSSDETVGEAESNQESTTWTASEKDSSFSKPLLAVGIVVINLAAIITYTKYKNSNVKSL